MQITTNKRTQRGFTLVEIAIVLVIVGLLLGGVLKGTELIESSKVKKAVNDINGTAAAYHSYQDRYRRVPGDDGPLATLTARGGSWATVTQGGGNNGVLTANLGNTFNGGGEHDNFWQHLKAAGFITGNPADAGAASLPRNAFGGLVGIANQAMGGGLGGVKVCLSQVPGKAAFAMDNQLDDGLGATGRMRATTAVAGANTNPSNALFVDPYNESNTYTVCVQI